MYILLSFITDRESSSHYSGITVTYFIGGHHFKPNFSALCSNIWDGVSVVEGMASECSTLSSGSLSLNYNVAQNGISLTGKGFFPLQQDLSGWWHGYIHMRWKWWTYEKIWHLNFQEMRNTLQKDVKILLHNRPAARSSHWRLRILKIQEATLTFASS